MDNNNQDLDNNYEQNDNYSSNLFPELDQMKEIDNAEKMNNFQDKLSLETEEEVPEEDKISLDIKQKETKKDKDVYDSIMNPKKPKKEINITPVFLIFIVIVVILAAYFGIKSKYVNLDNIKSYFKDNKLVCTKTDDYGTYSVNIMHEFKYRFNKVNHIASFYTFLSDDPEELNKISEENSAIVTNAIGFKGIKYEEELSETDYYFLAVYDLSKINFKSVLKKNNSNLNNSDQNRVTFIDISNNMLIDNVEFEYDNNDYSCAR